MNKLNKESDIITITLRATLVGNGMPSDDHASGANINIVNSKNIKVENMIVEPRSIHRFILSYDNPITKELNNITDDKELATIFAVALSLANSRVFFTTIVSKNSDDVVERPDAQKPSADSKIAKKTQASPNRNSYSYTGSGYIKISCSSKTKLTIPLKIGESKILNILNKLIPCFIPNTETLSSKKRDNIKESIKNYMSALNASASDGKSCYSSLYASFEKAVNANKELDRDELFIKEASKIAKIGEDKIRELRKFNNRLKHIPKNKKDRENLRYYEKHFYYLIQELKITTDQAILSRLNEIKKEVSK